MIPTTQDVPGSTLRVDTTILSGSVITNILNGIAHSRLVLADVSVASEGLWKGQRNGNVMYELGLAHAVRQPSEILLVRADDEPINFDIAQINVHKYSREDLEFAKFQISQLLSDLLRQIQQEKSLKVQRAIDLLDCDAIKYLSEFAVHGPFAGPSPKTMGETLIAISNRAALSRLQQLGIIRALLINQTNAYSLTHFGWAVVSALGLKVETAPNNRLQGERH